MLETYNDQLRINALSIEPIAKYVDKNIKSLKLSLPQQQVATVQTLFKELLESSSDAEAKNIKLYIQSDHSDIVLTAEKMPLDAYLLGAQSNKLRENSVHLTLL